MNKTKEIESFIMDMYDDPSPDERINSRSNELVDLIKSSKGNIGLVLKDKDLTDLIIKVSNGSDSKELINYLISASIPVKKKFSELINFSECSLGLIIHEVPKSESDDQGRILFDSEDRKIIVNKNFGYIIDKISRNTLQVKKFSTNGNISDLTNWKFISKKLATKESLANVVK